MLRNEKKKMRYTRKMDVKGVTYGLGPMFVRLLAPLTDSIFVEAAHQPQFPCPKVSRKTS